MREWENEWMGAIKYKTPKPVAHTARALQVLGLNFNYARLLNILPSIVDATKSLWKFLNWMTKRDVQNLLCDSWCHALGK
jgi:hypothetical protein